MLELIDLPSGVLHYIFSFICAEEIVDICFTCRKFYEIFQLRCKSDWADQIKSLGEALEDVKIECKAIDSSPLAELRKSLGAEVAKYETVLSKYGSLLGLWQPNLKPYGGLVQIKFIDGILLAVQFHCPQILTDPLREKKLFSIELQEDGNLECYCLAQSKPRHPCQLGEIFENSFTSKCTDPSLHIYPGGKEKEFIDWFFEETNSLPNLDEICCGQDLFMMKFAIMDDYKNSFTYKRLDYPKNIPGAVIQPGFFKGSYGSHGNELIMLSYDENMKIKGTKIIGDSNVPAFEVTFRSDLEPIVDLTEEERQTYIDLELIPIPQDESIEQLPQEESVHFSVSIEPDTTDLPKTWKDRFYGFGQIAGYGFSEPSETPQHLIVYDENTFSILWQNLYLLSMYYRVTEKFN